MRAQTLSRVWLLVTPWPVARQAPLSVGILQAGRLSFLPPGNFPTQGSNPHLFTSMSPALAEGFLTPWVRKGMGFHPGKGTTTHSSVLAWRILRTEEPGGLQSMRSQRVGHDWATSTCLPRSTEEAFKRHWRSKKKAGKNKELPYSWMKRPRITKISILPEVTESLEVA